MQIRLSLTWNSGEKQNLGFLMNNGVRIAFFGSSLLSAYWNGAATYYRGMLRALHGRGHSITFYEPDAFDRQKHKDISEPDYARSIVYAARSERDVCDIVRTAADFDVVVKASGVGVFDSVLEKAVLELQSSSRRVIFWDVDAPATLARMEQNPADLLRGMVPSFDLVFTYGGGEPVVKRYGALGCRRCVPVYNALDPSTHYPVAPNPAFNSTLGFLGNRLPDREDRVREFFLEPARAMPKAQFLLGGSGWEGLMEIPKNVRRLGHVYTRDHNAFNSTPKAVLNVNRDSMAENGFSPATRVFEAAGAGACIITDAWKGIEEFLEPDRECLVAETGRDIQKHLRMLTYKRAYVIGKRAFRRVLAQHTYAQRAAMVEEVLFQAPL